MSQQDIDAQNATFWNELCGSGLARSLGITDLSPDNLRRFDDAYLATYPYLAKYLGEDLRGKRVLEIGLGYGTLGQVIASKGSNYHGLDIAENPVRMMQYRAQLLGKNNGATVQVGSAFAIPYKNGVFDYVYSIGCLHHTGNIRQGIQELHRVLAVGGKAIIMLYNRRSYRQLVQVSKLRTKALLAAYLGKASRLSVAEQVRGLYDTNAQGVVTPHTDYISKKEAFALFGDFSSVQIDMQNFDTVSFFRGHLCIPREKALNNIARFLGLDLYIVATK